MCLKYQNNDPVDACQHRIYAEATWVMIVLSPYRVASLVLRAIARPLKCIDRSEYDQKKPGNNGKDLIGYEVSLGKFVAFGEGIV